MNCIFRTATVSVNKLLALCICPAILFYFTFFAEVERGSSDVQIAILDNLWHIAEEECHNQCVDVRTIDVGIGHDDNLMIAQLLYVGFLAVFVSSDSYTESCVDIADFITFQSLVIHGFFHIQNLTA